MRQIETRETETGSSGTLLRLTETYQTSAMELPRWGSRVRISSSAPRESSCDLPTSSVASVLNVASWNPNKREITIMSAGSET